MKKIMLIVLFFMFPSTLRAYSAKSYVAMNLDNNAVIFGSNIHDKRLIASITKIMTAIIVLQQGNLDDIFIVPSDIDKVVGSKIYLTVGEKIKIKDLLYGMMLRSGNDAAYCLALYISGSMDNFALLMNEYAFRIGMLDSFFINSSGLENEKGIGNISSAYDMGLITSYAMKNKTFRKIFKTKKYSCSSSVKKYLFVNKNKLLKYDYITGGKTGYTIKAKRTLVTTGTVSKMNIVVITLNDPDDWDDHKSIYEYIKNNYYAYNLSKNKVNKKYYLKKDIKLILDNNTKGKVKVSYNLFSNLKYRKDRIVGKINILSNKNVIYSDNLYLRSN